MNNATGVLSKTKALDREEEHFYSLVITATDNGQPPLSNQTTINITILDANDHIPEILTKTLFSVPEVCITPRILSKILHCASYF